MLEQVRCPILTTVKHEKEIFARRQYHGIVSSSRAVSSFHLEQGAFSVEMTKAGHVENKRAMKYKIEEQVAPTDDWVYLRNGIARNVALDGIIREGKTSEHFRCAIKNESFEADLSFIDHMDDLEGMHGEPTFPCKTVQCQLKDNVSIDISGHGLDRIPACIENLTKLKRMYLNNNQIKKIDGLDNLARLNTLTMNRNHVTRIEGIENLGNLKVLDLGNNLIFKIEGLDGLENLEDLYLENNIISRMENLDDLKKLKQLGLYTNRIEKMEGLDSLENLEQLNLRDNRIEEIDGLGNLTNLEKLWLRDNHIEKIEGFDGLENLREIVLSGNRIKVLEGNLNDLGNLKNFWLSDNLIDKIGDIKLPPGPKSTLTVVATGNNIPTEECTKSKERLFKRGVILKC
jgi:Leucine-rich repeat (LRR) protein